MGRLKRNPPLCACGCLNPVTWNEQKKCWNKYIRSHSSRGMVKSKELHPCACGECDMMVMERFAPGHNMKKHPKPIIWHPCECKKCDQMVKEGQRFVSGHNAWGHIPSEESREKNRQSHLGKPPNPISDEGREALRISRTGKKASKETIEKQRIAGKNRSPQSKETREKRSRSLTGGKRTEETKKILSLDKIEFYKNHPEKKMKGDQCAFYIDGRCSGENYGYPEDWRERLKEIARDRDGRQCQLCYVDEKYLDRKLDVHHINYDKENCDLSNLVSLCHKCHGKTNRNRNGWISLFKSPQRLILVVGDK